MSTANITVTVTDTAGASALATVSVSNDTTSIIPANRMTLWQPGVTYNGGFPSRAVVYKTLSPLGSGKDDTPQIQAALDTCPSNQIVQLTAGVFRINGNGLQCTTSNITLRGVGAGQALSTGINGVASTDTAGKFTVDATATQLIKADRTTNPSFEIMTVGNDPTQFSTSINLAADAIQGTYSLNLVSNPGLAVGEVVLIDQNTDNDPDVFWGPEHDPPGGGSRRWFVRQDRSINQMMEITAINGNTITFATPFHETFKTAYAAQLSRYANPLLKNVGIENIFFYGGMGGDWHGNVNMQGCIYSWFKNIESFWSVGTGIGLYGCYRCELRDSFLHETPDPSPGGAGYICGLNYGASDNLIENCIMWYGNKEIIMRGTGGGNVVAYNYMDDAFGHDYPHEVEAGVNACHYTTSHMELLEGNYSQNYKGDSFWGNCIDITIFRNWLSALRAAHPPLNTYKVNLGGQLYPYGDYQSRVAVDNQAYNYRANFVGNVLGMQNQVLLPSVNNLFPAQTTWAFEEITQLLPDGLVPMWYIGADQSHQAIDGNWAFVNTTYQTLLRQGNWDWVTKSQTWLGIGGTQTNPLGSLQVIPNSMYLTSAPAFFGMNKWPWVDPSTGTTYVLPAKARFESGKPNSV